MFLCSSPTCLFGRLSLARSLSLYHGLRGTPDACYSVVFAGPLASALGCLAACAEPASIQTRLGCTAQPPAHPACPRCVAVPCRADNTEHCRRRGHRAWVVYDHRCAGPSTSTPTPCLPIRMVATTFSAPSRAVPARHVRRRAGLLHPRPLTPPRPAPPRPAPPRPGRLDAQGGCLSSHSRCLSQCTTQHAGSTLHRAVAAAGEGGSAATATATVSRRASQTRAGSRGSRVRQRVGGRAARAVRRGLQTTPFVVVPAHRC